MEYFLRNLGLPLTVLLMVVCMGDLVNLLLDLEGPNLKEISKPLIFFIEAAVCLFGIFFCGVNDCFIAYICFLFNSIFYFSGIFILAIYPDEMVNLQFKRGSYSVFTPQDSSSSLDIEQSRKALCSFFILMGSLMAIVAASACCNYTENKKKEERQLRLVV